MLKDGSYTRKHNFINSSNQSRAFLSSQQWTFYSVDWVSRNRIVEVECGILLAGPSNQVTLNWSLESSWNEEDHRVLPGRSGRPTIQANLNILIMETKTRLSLSLRVAFGILIHHESRRSEHVQLRLAFTSILGQSGDTTVVGRLSFELCCGFSGSIRWPTCWHAPSD